MCCFDEVLLLLLLLCLTCCVVFGISFWPWRAIHISNIVVIHFIVLVSIGTTTSGAKKPPHRVVTLKSIDKGEEEMAF